MSKMVGEPYIHWTPAEAIASGVTPAEIGQDLKAWAGRQVRATADTYRARLASASAGKLAEYRFKEEIARDPASASEAELALIEREAVARGMTRHDLITIIARQAAAYRQIALLVGVIEAEAVTAVAAIPDAAADTEARVLAALATAKTEAETEFQRAMALISGGV